jgi:hypothetical protein
VVHKVFKAYKVRVAQVVLKARAAHQVQEVLIVIYLAQAEQQGLQVLVVHKVVKVYKVQVAQVVRRATKVQWDSLLQLKVLWPTLLN